jgi:hypothetical protein
LNLRSAQTNGQMAAGRSRRGCRVRGVVRHDRDFHLDAGRPQEDRQRGRSHLRGKQQQHLSAGLHISDYPHEP